MVSSSQIRAPSRRGWNGKFLLFCGVGTGSNVIQMANSAPLTFADLAANRFGAAKQSEWLAMDQDTITRFGMLTLDPDRNHIDPVFAAAHSPFGGPIAFGFQSLAMLTYLANSAGAVPQDATHVINYGFDHVRFIAPVRAGARIRGRFTLADVRQRRQAQICVTYGVEVEIEGEPKPALVARWLALYEGEMPA